MRHAMRRALLVAAFLPALACPAWSQSLRWDALGSAGGFSLSGTANLGATLGQPLNGTSAAGSFIETVGFWHPPVPGLVAVDPVPAAPGELRIAAIVPNPSADAMLIRFAVPVGTASVPISIEIIDLSGRVVRTLLSGPRETGLHAVAWDGRAADGSRSPSGIYFCRLQAAGHRSVRRLALIR